MLAIAAVVIMLILFPLFPVMFDRWMPLVFSIIIADKSRLQEDILESGICESKRDGWLPKSWRPKPQSQPLEGLCDILFPQFSQQPPASPVPPLQPLPPIIPRPLFRDDFEKLTDQMFRELD